MRSMKMLVTLAATALVAIAALGAGSASAYTVLCGAQESWCAKPLPAGTTIKTSLKTNPGEVSRFRITEKGSGDNFIECNSHEFTFTSTAKYGYPSLPAQFQGSVNPSECRFLESSSRICTSASLSKNSAPITDTYYGAGYARVGNASAPLTLKFTCSILGAPITCEYKATEAAVIPLEFDNYGGFTVPVLSNEEHCGSDPYLYLFVETYKNAAQPLVTQWYP